MTHHPESSPHPHAPHHFHGWFDAHLDLAYLAEAGRNMTAPPGLSGGPSPPGAVTFESLRAGHIRAALGTIFIQQRVTSAPDPRDNAEGTWTYASEDEAHVAALRQISHYLEWRDAGLIRLVSRGGGFHRPEYVAGDPLDVMILMEGAPGVRSLRDLQTFYDAGVRVISLTWAAGNKWCGGDRTGGDISPAGRELVAEIDRLGMVHDVSHLSEQAFWTLLKIARGPKMASHSNCRALLPGRRAPERHLSDEQIKALVDAGGVIGVVLFNGFLVPEGHSTSADVLHHIAHIEKLTGRRDCIALGSDMDGGFSARDLPSDLDHPRKLTVLLDALKKHGWSANECAGFAYENWAAFFRRVL